MSNNFIRNPKLFLLLKTLDKKELKQFDDWLSSKFHNNSDKVLNLYRGLRAIYKKLDKPIGKRTLLQYTGIKSISKSDRLSSKEALILRQTMSALNRQIQEFLCWQKFKEDDVNVNCRLVDALMDRRQYKLIPTILEKSKRELESSPHRNIQFYENIFQLTERGFHIDIILNNRNTNVEIQQELINRLWQTHLVRTLKYYCAGKNGEKIRKINYNYPLIKPLNQYIEDTSDNEISLIQMYHILLNLIEEEEPECFYTLKKHLFDNFDIFDIFIVRQFLNYLTNYCARAIKLGKYEFVQEKQEVYELGLQLNCWSRGIYFSAHQFINIVTNALKLNKIEWTVDCITQYKEKLNPDIKEDTLNYCYAMVHFQLKEYDKAQDYLIKITSPEDFIYHLQFKIFLIKIYYEQQPLSLENMDTYPIYHQLEAIRHYVMSTRNTKMSEPVRESYNNFVRLLKRILNRREKLICRGTVKTNQLDKLKQELLAESPFVERQWLQEKIEELG